jgi:hypothetical protein
MMGEDRVAERRRYGNAREKIKQATGREGYSALIEPETWDALSKVSMTLREYERLAAGLTAARQSGIEQAIRYFAGTKALYGTDWIARACSEYGIEHGFGGGSAPIAERTDVKP